MRCRGLALALVLLAGCRQKSQAELDCLADAASMSPSLCYARARAAAYVYGADYGDRTGYDAGYEQCEADRDTGDSGDTGDTGGR
ncbi:MAG: hypothetical protein Q8P41_23590 [Pseudomonadota bacterium]|nr:hypothetical protein [Pseudomonadota bacterium]